MNKMIEQASEIIDTLFSTEQEFRAFVYEWTTFVFLTSLGGFTRAIYNFDKMKRIQAYLTFRLIVSTFFVAFVSKHILDQSGHQHWEFWAIPVIAYSAEVVLKSYDKHAPNLIEDIVKGAGQKLINILQWKPTEKINKDDKTGQK